MFEEGQEILEKRYRVIKKLGGGAFGEIYKGKSSSNFSFIQWTYRLLW
jgi:serine/threonine protein kinase